MSSVSFTGNLKRFYPELNTMHVEAETVAELLDKIEERFPGIKDYIVDEDGRLRKHVNIFIGNEMIRDQQALTDQIDQNDSIYIMQALSGG